MAWNSSGGHDRVHNWVADKNAAINITASRMDAEFDDISTALENCLTRDGQNSPSANLPMNNLHHTGVSNATGLTQYAAADQVVKGTLLHAATASAAGTDTYAVSLSVSPGSYSRGQVFSFIPDVANTGACSVNFNSIGAGNIKLINGNDPYDGAIQISKDVVVRYDGTNFILMNPYNFTDLAGIVVATAAEINTLALSGVTNADLVKLHAVTSTAAEMSKLAGTPAGLTATEIGYLDGVTSAIQAQIDSKNAGPLTGDVTTVAAASTIANDAVTNAKLANMATQTIKGRTTAGTGDPEDLTAAQASAIIKDVAETLTNKTLTSPVLNGSLSGTAFLDDDTMAANSAVATASQQSIKAYVDGRTAMRLVILDTPEQLVTGFATQNVWTTHNSATLNTANAKAAIIKFHLLANIVSGSVLRANGSLRKTGSALAANDLTNVAIVEDEQNSAGNMTNRIISTAYVNLDSNYDFDYHGIVLAGDTMSIDLVLVGYYV